MAPYPVRVPRKCTPKCYEDRVLPVLLRKRVSVTLIHRNKYVLILPWIP